jgi:hypothetical protein
MNIDEIIERVNRHDTLSWEEWIQYDLTHMTDAEVRMKYHLSKTDMKNLIYNKGIKILYKNRTPYSKALIPVDSDDNELCKKEKREEWNNIHAQYNNSNWLQKEKELRRNIIKESSMLLGCLYAKTGHIAEEIERELKTIAYEEFIINVIENLTPGDYIGLMLEERHGKYEVPEKLTQNILSTEMIKSFIAEKYGINKAIQVIRILEDRE